MSEDVLDKRSQGGFAPEFPERSTCGGAPPLLRALRLHYRKIHLLDPTSVDKIRLTAAQG